MLFSVHAVRDWLRRGGLHRLLRLLIPRRNKERLQGQIYKGTALFFLLPFLHIQSNLVLAVESNKILRELEKVLNYT